MGRVPLFVRSARRAKPKPTAAGRVLAFRPRWQTVAVLASGMAIVIATLAMAGAQRGIVLAPVVVHDSVPLAAREVDALLHRELATLHERAHRDHALSQPADSDWPVVELPPPPGSLTDAARWLHRAMGREGRRVSVEIAALPDHFDVVVRDAPSRAMLHARVAHGPLASERLVTRASELVLLMTAPIAAAALALDDPRTLADASRRDEVLTVALRDADAANDARVALLRGIDAAASGQCEQALSFYAAVIASHPRAPQARVLAAECDIELGERDRALARLKQATQDADASAFALSLAGQAYRRVGDAEQGLTLLRAAHARDPESQTNAVAIGEALLALHRPAEALAWLARHTPEPAMQARWLGALGVAQVRTGAGPAAQATVAKLRTVDPASTEATRIEAELAAAMKAWPQALGRFGALRVVAPNDAAAHAGEGRALLGLGRPDEAVAAYRRCGEHAPWLAECRLGLATALREADQPEAALDVLTEAAQLDRVDPRIPLETARTLRSLQRRDEAAVHTAHAEVLARRLDQRLPLP